MIYEEAKEENEDTTREWVWSLGTKTVKVTTVWSIYYYLLVRLCCRCCLSFEYGRAASLRWQNTVRDPQAKRQMRNALGKSHVL